MGFFSKIKANFNHGGVTVRVTAPSAVASDQVIPVQVTLTADSTQTIVSVKAEIKAQMREQGIGLGNSNSNGVGQSTTTSQTVAVAENREQFELLPGQPKTVELQLYMNGGAPGIAQVGEGLGALGSIVQSIVQNLDHVNYLYTVHASADVNGITLDPSDSQAIQVLPPNQSV